MDKGATLNKRVWELFERAGFKTKPNTDDPQEYRIDIGGGNIRTPDLFAEHKELGVTIIGWNKSGEFKSFTTHMHDYEKLMTKSTAQTVLFVATGKPVDTKHRELAKSKGMNVWDADELNYFESVVDTVGEYAKYEILRSLAVETKEQKMVHHVLALRIRQPLSGSETELFLFPATPQMLLKTCVVLRKASGVRDAYQRILKKKRLAEIKAFVTNEKALLPTNIIVHLGRKVEFQVLPKPESVHFTSSDYDLGLLKIPQEYASIEIIDGQHRLFGFIDTEPATKNQFNLVILGIRTLSSEQRTATSVSINDKARRMDPNLVSFLRLTDDEDACQKDAGLMAIKVVFELSKVKPFKGRIKVLDVGNQRITLKGFAGYDLRGLVGKTGLLRKYHGRRSVDYVKVLAQYFSVLRKQFPKEWDDPNKYIPFTNRGISAFLKLLKSILKHHNGKLDLVVMTKYLRPLKKHWSQGWETGNLKNAYVGSKGWKDFHKDLVAAILKEIPDFNE